MKRGNSGNSIDLILVGKCPLSVIRLKKRRNNLRSINRINGFGARSYSICGMCLAIVLLTYLSIIYKLKHFIFYLKSGKITSYYSYSLSRVHHKLCLRKAFGVSLFETFIITPCRIYSTYDAKRYYQMICQTY